MTSVTAELHAAVLVRDRIMRRVVDAGDCWIWTGSRFGRYGGIYAAGRHRLVHKVLYEIENGPVPGGLELDHLCRNRLCVRPAHLEAVTHQENVLRGGRHLAAVLRGNVCRNGHSGMMVRVEAGLLCRECRREANRRYRKRQQVAA